MLYFTSQTRSGFGFHALTTRADMETLNYLQWLISPTKEAYVAMPQWLRPTAAQIAVPHAAWIDNIPWLVIYIIFTYSAASARGDGHEG